MNCFFCKGDLYEDETTHVTDLSNSIIIIKKVPCLKCRQCGEVSYVGTVAAQLEKIIDSLAHTFTEVAIVNYSESVA